MERATVSAATSVLTKQQAAEHLQVSPRYIERMVRAGRLRAFKPTGGLFRVRLCDLTAFLESGSSIAGIKKGGAQ
jgi:excisionase family DNA binding protein